MLYDMLLELLCMCYVIVSHDFVVILLMNREHNWSTGCSLEHLEHTSSIVSKKVNGYKLRVYLFWNPFAFMNFAQS